MNRLSPRQLIACFTQAVGATIRHDGIEHAGYLAFLGLLALFPFLVFMVAVIGFIGQGEMGASLITSVLQSLPHDITMALQPRVVEIVSGPPEGLLTLSVLGAIWTASSAVEGLRTILNRAYHVATPPAYWFRRTLSIVQFLIFTFAAISGMLLVIATPLILQHIEGWLGIDFLAKHQEYWNQMLFPLTVGIMFIAISGIYYTLPNIRQRFISVAPGAAMVVIGWLWAAQLFTLYLSHFEQVSLIYGSLGGIIVALIFFYICNMVFIFGAEFNYQLGHELGIHMEEKEHIDSSVPNNAKE